MPNLLSTPSALRESLAVVGEQLASVAAQLQAALDQLARLNEIAPASAPNVEPDALALKLQHDFNAWDGAFSDAAHLGMPWADEPEWEADRRRLLDGVSLGNSAAMNLAGRLMIVRAARREQLPLLLKEVGEAFYEWRSSAPELSVWFPSRLTQWLEQRCIDVGLRHKIELVNVGDRFDRLRHHAAETGLEVVEVRGWIVLRDDGTICTRAWVGVR